MFVFKIKKIVSSYKAETHCIIRLACHFFGQRVACCTPTNSTLTPSFSSTTNTASHLLHLAPNHYEQTVDDDDDDDRGEGGKRGAVTWIIKMMKGRCVSCTGPSQLRCKHSRLPGDRVH